MKKLTAADLNIKIYITPSDSDAYEALGECMKKKEIKALLEEADSNMWQWCDVELRATYNGLKASDYLGASSYQSEEDFIANSGYYDDMINTVVADLQKQAEAFVNAFSK